MVDKSPARFENFIAVQLQRAVSCWNEKGKGSFQLHYLRTKEGQEVDFVITNKNKAVLLVEVKESDTSLSTHLPFFQNKIQANLAIQVINRKGYCVQKDKRLYIVGADRFCAILP